MSKKRLTKTRTGTGDSGFTELVKGYRYPKSHDLCFIYNYLQNIIADIQIYLNEYSYLLDEEDLKILREFKNPIINNTNAILWTKFEDLQDIFNKFNVVDKFIIENRYLELNEKFESADEFIVFNSTEACKLVKITNSFRNIEHFVWSSIHTYYSYIPEYIPEHIKGIGSFYNLVGDYFFNLCRYIEKKLNVPEEYWKHD